MLQKMLKKIVLLLSLSIISLETSAKSFIQHAKNYSDTTQKIAVGSLATSVLLLGGYGLYKLGQWFFEKSDQQVFDEAQAQYSSLTAYYRNFFDVWDQDICWDNDEANLSRLSKPLHHMTYYLIEFERDLHKLIQIKLMLENRIEKIMRSNNNATLLFRMETLLNELEYLELHLNQINNYLNDHRAYFNLKMLFENLDRNYKQESTSIEDYENGLYTEQTINDDLARCVLLNATNSNYPYITYIDQITEDIRTLNNTISDCKPTNYPYISTQAKKLRHTLVTAKSMVVLHNNYHAELCAYERNKLEQQRIAQEQQRISLERMRIFNNYVLYNPLLPHMHVAGTFCPYCLYC